MIFRWPISCESLLCTTVNLSRTVEKNFSADECQNGGNECEDDNINHEKCKIIVIDVI